MNEGNPIPVSASSAIAYHNSLTSGAHGITVAGAAITTAVDVAAQQTALGLVIGTNVQAQDSELSAIAGLTSAADKLPYFTGSGTAALTDITAAGRALLDDATAAAQRTTLDVPGLNTANTFTGAQKVQAAANQDAVELVGRAGGTSGFKVSVTPLGLSANRTLSLPDETGTIATRNSQTFFGMQIFDFGTGAIPTEISSSTLRIIGENNTYPGIEITGFYGSSPTGCSVFGRGIGGTRDAMTATVANSTLIGMGGFGYSGSVLTGQVARFIVVADGTFSASNYGAYFQWDSTPNGSTARAPWMTLRNGVLSLTNTTEATDKDTGSIVTEGGIGVEKSIFAGGDLQCSGVLKIDGTQVVKEQQSAIADVSTADATDLASAVALANANKAKINSILAMLRTHGLIAT
jgi:hypothetical protein